MASGPKRLRKRLRVYERDGYRCVTCGFQSNEAEVIDLYERARRGQVIPLARLTLDHVIPRSLGGNSDDANLQAMCVACNNKKGNRTSIPMAVAALKRRAKKVKKKGWARGVPQHLPGCCPSFGCVAHCAVRHQGFHVPYGGTP